MLRVVAVALFKTTANALQTIWEPSDLEAMYAGDETNSEFGLVNENEDTWIVINYSKESDTQQHMDDIFERAFDFYSNDKYLHRDKVENIHWVQAEVDTPRTTWMSFSTEEEITEPLLVIIGRYGKAFRMWKVSELAETWTDDAYEDSKTLYGMILEEARSRVHVFNDCNDMKINLHFKLQEVDED